MQGVIRSFTIMKNSKLIKHIAGISAGLMLAVGTGAVVSSQNVVHADAPVAPVKSSVFKLLEGKHIETDRDTEMMPIDEYLTKIASWNTTPNPYKLNGHNNIKFYWYKKAHVRGAWDNIDTQWSQAINSTLNTSGIGGKTIVMGTVNVNGVHYYITGDSDEQEMIYRGTRNLEPSAYFEQPKIGYVTKTIHTYQPNHENSSIDNDGYSGMVLSKGIVNIKANHTIMIPSHHNAVELFGTKYVPVIFNDDTGTTGSTLIKYSDFQNYVTSGEGCTFRYNGDINYQKNGRVYSKEKDVYQAAKIESRKLKSAKRRKSYEKRIINDLKHNKKMQTEYGLA